MGEKPQVRKINCSGCGKLLGIQDGMVYVSKWKGRKIYARAPLIIVCETCGSKTEIGGKTCEKKDLR